MIKDPDQVARLAAEREEENWRFRTWLKMLRPARAAKASRLAEEFGREAEAAMDCTACAACCRSHQVPVIEAEIQRLASRLSLPVLTFERVHTEDVEGERVLRTPCPLLDGTRCGVYQDRPEPCRTYPCIGGDIVSRMVAIIERASVCPIVFDMLERLKPATGFLRRR